MAISLTVSQILADLQAGLTRNDIGEKYGLNKAQVKALFTHPKLKNKKTIKEKGTGFQLVDDTVDQQSTNTATTSTETTQETVAEVATATDDTVQETVFDQLVAEEPVEQPAEQPIATDNPVDEANVQGMPWN